MEYIRPRLRLTSYCNRNCPYCFADDFIGGKKNLSHLKIDEIRKILEMSSKSNISSVAWQGGEPMIHPQIIEIIQMHEEADMKVSIFTNGLFNSEIVEYLKNLDFQMLVNLNHPDTYRSIDEYNRVIKNIEKMNEIGVGDRVSLGYNFYEDNPDYEFFLDAIKKCHIKSVRIDMVRPSISENNIHYEFEKVGHIFPQLKQMNLIHS